MDAVRLADNRHVVLKKLDASSEEIRIAQYLSSKTLSSDLRNHTVPILETIYDPSDKKMAFIVMPILLQMDDLPFRRVGEFAEAVHQYLTVCVLQYQLFTGIHWNVGSPIYARKQHCAQVRALFLKENLFFETVIRDPCYFNLMMDATELIPGGFHFMKSETCDGVNEWTEWRERRSVKSLRYFFIDFGLSRQYLTNRDVRDVGILGQDQSYPERSATIPYDPFKTDIYQLGNAILNVVKVSTAVSVIVINVHYMSRSMTVLNTFLK